MMNAVNEYKEVAAGHKRRLAPGTWQNKEKRISILKYVLEEVLELEISQIPRVINLDLLQEHKIQGVLVDEKTTLYEACKEAYPATDWKPWDFSITLTRYWKSAQTRREAVEWLVDRLEKSGKTKLVPRDFEKVRMKPMLEKYYDGCAFKCTQALGVKTNMMVPSMIRRKNPKKNNTVIRLVENETKKKWEYEEVLDTFWWKRRNRVEAMLWLHKLYGGNMTPKTMLQAGLAGLYRFYDGNIMRAMAEAREDQHMIEDSYTM